MWVTEARLILRFSLSFKQESSMWPAFFGEHRSGRQKREMETVGLVFHSARSLPLLSLCWAVSMPTSARAERCRHLSARAPVPLSSWRVLCAGRVWQAITRLKQKRGDTFYASPNRQMNKSCKKIRKRKKRREKVGGLVWLLSHSLLVIWTTHPHIYSPHLSSEAGPRHQDEAAAVCIMLDQHEDTH